MSDFLSKGKNMNLIRFGIIAGAHLIVLAIIYLMSGIGNGDIGDERIATAGANGIVNWSSKDPGAQSTTVSASGFDSRTSDLAGFNEGDAILEAQTGVPVISSRQRFEPTRPGGSSSPQTLLRSSNNDVLTPVRGQPASGYQQPSDIIAREGASHVIRYTVSNGDSIWGITRKFNVTSAELHSVNPSLTNNIQLGQVLNVPRQSSDAGSSSTGSPVPQQVEGTFYTVKKGDALSRIAAGQGVTLNALRSANNLRGDLIRVGQKLIIPNSPGSTWAPSPLASRKQGLQVVVETGDSLSSIAARYNVSIKDLILHNNIQNPRLINVGQTFFIPGSTSNAAAPAVRSQPVSEPAFSQPVIATLGPTTRPIPEDVQLQLVDEDDVFVDEDSIEEPVIQIEE
jgi:LysM repeat protein